MPYYPAKSKSLTMFTLSSTKRDEEKIIKIFFL